MMAFDDENRLHQGDGQTAYGDILGLSRPKSLRPPMPQADRAAQFAPFAALTGHGDAVTEAARYVEARRPLSDEQKARLDREIRLLKERLTQLIALGRLGEAGKSAYPVVAVSYFVPDGLKEGGTCASFQGAVRILDEVCGKLVFCDGAVIALEEIRSLKVLSSA